MKKLKAPECRGLLFAGVGHKHPDVCGTGERNLPIIVASRWRPNRRIFLRSAKPVATCHPSHAVRFEKGLRGKSPENGNMAEALDGLARRHQCHHGAHDHLIRGLIRSQGLRRSRNWSANKI
jgi:hypothetical protein